MANMADGNTETRVQELVSKYRNLRSENEKLKSQIMALKQLQSQLEEVNKSLQEQLSQALLLKALVLSEGDKTAAKKAIQSMIKDVDKCIHYLYK